jgi:hypothetical protein
MAGQRQEAGRDGQHNRSYRSRPCPSVCRTALGTGAHGRIADGGGPESRPAMHKRRSVAHDPGRAYGL